MFFFQVDFFQVGSNYINLDCSASWDTRILQQEANSCFFLLPVDVIQILTKLRCEILQDLLEAKM